MDADTNHLIPMRRGGFFDGPVATLTAGGHDASPTGKGGFTVIPIQEPNARTGKSTNCAQHGMGIGQSGDPMFTLNTKQHAVGFMPARTAAPDGGIDERYAQRDVCDALNTRSGTQSNKSPVIAFTSKDHGADAGPLSPTLRAGGHVNSHANGGVMPAVMTLAIRGRGDGANLEVRFDDTANAILTPSGGRAGIGCGAVAFHPTQDPISSTDGTTHAMGCGSDGGTATAAAQIGMSVRRLTPVECERLMGLPDNWTLVPGDHRPRKPEDRLETVLYLMDHGFSEAEANELADTPDGPRYKAIGNSMATTVMQSIGRSISEVEAAIQLKLNAPLAVEF